MKGGNRPMTRIQLKYTLLILILLVLLTGCSSNRGNNTEFQEKLDEKDRKISELEDRIKELEENKNNNDLKSDNLLDSLINVLESIKVKDMDKLSLYIHPSKGIRFSPYPSVEIDRDRVFNKDEIKGIKNNNEVYEWGNYDGSGNPISLNFSDYYERFVYDVDFFNPDIIGNNEIIASGNAVENVKEVYPHGQFIEFYVKGDNPDLGDTSWRSLKLVFEEENGSWYLVGIIHGEWTI